MVNDRNNVRVTVYFGKNCPDAEYSRWGNRSYENEPLKQGWYDVISTDNSGVVTLAVNLSEKKNGKKDVPLKFQPSAKHLYRIKESDLTLASDKIKWK